MSRWKDKRRYNAPAPCKYCGAPTSARGSGRLEWNDGTSAHLSCYVRKDVPATTDSQEN